jgi:uncharacterized protein (TIGR03089 family)
MTPDRSRSTLADVLTDRTRTLGHRPFVTWYDDVAGARTELSYATADNWAGKAANLLVEELDVAPAAVVRFDLDGHWAATVLALACWKAGAAVTSDAPGDATVVCCHESRVDDHPTGPLVVVGDGLRTEPTGDGAPRDGLVLLGEEVHAFGDDYDDPDVSPASPALLVGDAPLDHAAVIARADRWREALGPGPRVGLGVPVDDGDALVVLAGVLAAGGSVVAARCAAGSRGDRWATEKVTVAVTADGTPTGVLPTFAVTGP